MDGFEPPITSAFNTHEDIMNATTKVIKVVHTLRIVHKPLSEGEENFQTFV